ncbi:MAG: aminotransferase class I/II-fold pyridoxal phosphate-dependent enzyme, partial [Bdellovibrionales bacterium]|nr:aminotransferase class I/II-fold pyridoxal phosphate-dependent enzyme [Bdellovibrionales bacterium]
MVEIPRHIQTLVPYRSGRSLEDIQTLAIKPRMFAKLASNENPLGPSPKAMEAIRLHLDSCHIYPDPTATKLVRKLSDFYSISENRIVCAHGSDAILEYLSISFLSQDDEILTSDGSFIGIYVIAKKLNKLLRRVPLKQHAYDLDRIYESIQPQTKIIYLSNPNNPSGTYFNKTQWETFLDKIPNHILIVLDEAYFEYAKSTDDYPNGLNYQRDNLLVLRTFSKAHGLAGVRVG